MAKERESGHNDMMGERPLYELTPVSSQRRPRLRGTVVQRSSGDALIDALLADLFLHAGNCVREFGDFHLLLDADPAVEPVLRRLMYDLPYREMPWGRTRLWLAGERRVPTDDPRRAWSIAYDLVVTQSGIPEEQAHAIDPDAPEGYDTLLREHLGWRPKGQDRPDFALLVLRSDGGAGALRTGACTARGDFCQEVCPPDEPPIVGVGASLLNAARFVAVYGVGEEGRAGLEALERAMATPRAQRPALGGLALAPAGGELRWYLDPACCLPAPGGMP